MASIEKINVLLFSMNDDKFYNIVYESFMSDGRYSCEGLLYLNAYDKCLINNPKSLRIIRNKRDLKDYLKKSDYDLIYFFSMDTLWWKLIDYIPLEKTIIWWAWGYDIYEPQSRGVRPLFKIPLYKALTLEYLNSTKPGFLYKIKGFVKRHTVRYYYEHVRLRNIRRIDFLQPVLSEEYRLINGLKVTRAEEFYSPETIDFYKRAPMVAQGGDIQIGNSSSYTNNHLDVWHDIQNYIPRGRTIIIPLSYGDKSYAEFLKSEIHSDNVSIKVLDTFMPYEQYSAIISNCSYAVYGVIRQQAMGNIRIALRSGVKLFFYRDSIVYKHLINKGYCVFAIEEIDEESFKTPLSEEQIHINEQASIREYNERKQIRDKATEKIQSKMSNVVCCEINKVKI